jgi:predicted transcriptional regulator
MYRWMHRTKDNGANKYVTRSAKRDMAEIVDKELLHYIEPEYVYITTDKGYIFLKKADNINKNSRG